MRTASKSWFLAVLALGIVTAFPVAANWQCIGGHSTPETIGQGGTCSSSENAARNAAIDVLLNGNDCWSQGLEICSSWTVLTQSCVNLGGGVCEARARVDYSCWVCTSGNCPPI